MHPVLFELKPFTIYTYGVLVAAGFLVGLWYAHSHAARAGLSPRKIWNLGVYGIIVALAASKLWLVASDLNFYLANPREIFSMATFESAGTFYGGVLGGLLFVLLYTHLQKMPLLKVLDVCAAPVALGHAIGRVGCFAAGCCYGKPTTLPWGVTFTSPVAERIAGTPLGLPLHPTQLYEAAAEFLNFLLLLALSSRRRFTGQLIGAYFILYGIERGAIEFLRGDPGRGLMFHGAISLMQLVSAGLIVAGAALWWRGLHHQASGASNAPHDANDAPHASSPHAPIDSPSPS
jgi:phosphatidylglycerol---prolipoprotein diacylglyceryl transferase